MLKIIYQRHNPLQAAAQPVDKGRGPIALWAGEALRQALLFPALRLVAPLTVEGTEHLRGVGPFIFAANHSSHLDALVILAALPGRLRQRVRVAAAADYFFTNRIKGLLVSMALNAFAFERRGPGCNASLDEAQRLLRAGQSVLIFPEGTRSPDGQMQPFKRGVGTLALADGIPVIPIHIEGAHEAWPKGAFWPRRHQIAVRFGAPLCFAQPGEPLEVAACVERAVRNLADAAALQAAA
jgi:1-acyl-sn-glycerol-3-phosphate acyltransferase